MIKRDAFIRQAKAQFGESLDLSAIGHEVTMDQGYESLRNAIVIKQAPSANSGPLRFTSRSALPIELDMAMLEYT